LGVGRFISDDPYEVLKMSSYGTSFNLDGIWGGNMFAGGSGAILPNKITSKHNIRYVPNMSGLDIVAKIRKHLDEHGYSDVKINIVGDVPWAKTSTDTEIGRSVAGMFGAFGITQAPLRSDQSIMGGYWPAYLFSGFALNVPINGGMVGMGGNSHAANEYYVIEGAGKVYGMAGAEKSVATALYNFAGLNGSMGDAPLTGKPSLTLSPPVYATPPNGQKL
jgi:acetylornithine deacetylase/succinyl-diaminopimelate desuccinylase-like protein